jgi:hypothetical protein
MTTRMMVTTKKAKSAGIPRVAETQAAREAARSVRERAPSLEQTQALLLARRRNASPRQSARPAQKNPQA